MMVVVCPNPALDRIALVPGFQAGRIHRVQSLTVLAAGKGVNVARILAELGHAPVLLGFAGGNTGRMLVEGIERFGGRSRFTPVPGETRTCYLVVDPGTGVQTVINEQGPEVPPAAVEAFSGALAAEVGRLSALAVGPGGRRPWMVFSGSLPPGVPADLYARAIGLCRAHGVATLLDTSGAPLAAGVEAGPTVVKTNRQEYEGLLALRGDAGGRAASAAAAPGAPGPTYIVTDGGGAIEVMEQGKRWRLRPPQVQVVNAVAAGDSFTAGLVSQLAQGVPLEGAVRFAAACASIKVGNLLPELGVPVETIQEVASQIPLEA